MGIYSINNETFGRNYDVVADESYSGVEGGLIAMLDIQRNNHAMFEALIARDFQEAYMIHEGASDMELISFNEASAGGIIDKIKTTLKKIWEKIKGVFKTFITKLDGIINRDTKALVKKYHKDIIVKDLHKFKYKACKKQKGYDDLMTALSSDSNEFKKMSQTIIDDVWDEKDIKKIRDAISDGEYKDQIMRICFKDIEGMKNTDYKDLKKEMHESCFDTKESEEGIDTSEIKEIEDTLTGQEKSISNIKKMQNATDKHFNGLLKSLDKAKDQFAKDTSDKEWENGDTGRTIEIDRGDGANPKAGKKKKGGFIEDNNARITYTKHSAAQRAKAAGTLHDAVVNIQTIYTQTISCFLGEIKFYVGQCKGIYMKLATYNDKKAKNEAFELYLDAVQEASEYEFESDFEEYAN